MSPLRLLLRPALAIALSTLVAAQLDLPDRSPARPRGSAAGPASPARPAVGGSGRASERRRGLDLPDPASPDAAPAPGAQPPATPEPLPAGGPPDAFLASLRGVRTLDDPRLAAAAAELSRAGPDGLEAARRALSSKELGALVAAARHLCAAGTPEDRGLVAARLHGELPAAASGALLDALFERDPVTGSPALLVELLDHDAAAMRQAAARRLGPLLAPELIPLLASRLRSERADTRLRAIELLARIPDPGVVPILVGCLGDPNGQVAARAVRALALAEEPETAALLRERAFGREEIDRGGAFALLALVEREDRQGEVLTGFGDVEPLVRAHRFGQPIVSGAAAACLAGIGFRTPASPATAWLDREVPHTLVRLGSGAEFHSDFSALAPIALRRLALVSGEELGAEGMAWRRWWTGNARGFHARRAVIEVEPGAAPALSVTLRRGDAPALRIAGPASPAVEQDAVVVIDEEACAELVAALRAEGALGLERLPRRRSGDDAGEVALLIAVGEQEKRFEHATGAVPPWIERVGARLEELADARRWQRFRDRSRYPTRRAFVEDEGAWWRAPHGAAERERRLAELALGVLANARGAEREAALDELERLFAREGVARAADLDRLLPLVAAEPSFGPALERLVELALAAARASGDEPPLDPRSSDALREALARHGEASLGSLGRVLCASGAGPVRAAAADPAPLLRRAAAHAALLRGDEGSGELLLELAADEEWSVAAAAIEGLGERRSPEVRAFLRARLGSAPAILEPVLLRALGRVGGEGARDELVLALASEDPRVQLAAVEALAELADPATASILVSVLARDEGPAWSAAARRGLVRIGEEARPQLLRMAGTPSSRGQRAAALLLAELGVAEVAPILFALLAADPEDAAVAAELCVLSGVDLRGEPDPAEAWAQWWQLVVREDALAWFRAALEREGVRAPAAEELRGPSAAGATFLAELAGKDELPWHLRERARRELERILGEPVAERRGVLEVGEPASAARPLEEVVRERWGPAPPDGW